MKSEMNYKHALEMERIYLNKLRKMTGQERLMIANGLYNLAINIAKAGIAAQIPGISEKDAKKELLRRIYKKDGLYRNFINNI